MLAYSSPSLSYASSLFSRSLTSHPYPYFKVRNRLSMKVFFSLSLELSDNKRLTFTSSILKSCQDKK